MRAIRVVLVATLPTFWVGGCELIEDLVVAEVDTTVALDTSAAKPAPVSVFDNEVVNLAEPGDVAGGDTVAFEYEKPPGYRYPGSGYAWDLRIGGATLDAYSGGSFSIGASPTPAVENGRDNGGGDCEITVEPGTFDETTAEQALEALAACIAPLGDKVTFEFSNRTDLDGDPTPLDVDVDLDVSLGPSVWISEGTVDVSDVRDAVALHPDFNGLVFDDTSVGGIAGICDLPDGAETGEFWLVLQVVEEGRAIDLDALPGVGVSGSDTTAIRFAQEPLEVEEGRYRTFGEASWMEPDCGTNAGTVETTADDLSRAVESLLELVLDPSTPPETGICLHWKASCDSCDPEHPALGFASASVQGKAKIDL